MESKNTSKNAFFPVLTFDLNRDQQCETARAGPKTLPVPKVVAKGVDESGELAGPDGGCLKDRLKGEKLAGGRTVTCTDEPWYSTQTRNDVPANRLRSRQHCHAGDGCIAIKSDSKEFAETGAEVYTKA